MRYLSLLAALTLVLGHAGCSSDDNPVKSGDPLAARQLPEDIALEASEVVDGNNAFALDIYRALKDEEGNLFLSPFSISTAFAMLHAGVRENTEAQMAEVFHFPLEQDRLHEAFHALLTSLNRGVDFGGYRLDLANRLWGQTGYDFLDQYLTITSEKYLAGLAELDFAADPDAARRTINGWVEDQTQDLIKDLMPAGSITALTRLVLTNAIYFKGTWETQFDPDKTEDGAFHLADGGQVQVPMMHQDDEVRAGFHEDVQVLEIPYTGRDLSMLVLLPAKMDGLPDLENALTPEWYAALLATLHDTEMPVYLPRFEMTSRFSLNQTLAAMGMPDAFTPGLADLSGINGEHDLSVQAAIHKAYIKVNEEGTEAAAATGISVGPTSVPTAFVANHPFLFLIRDNVTGSILFLGRVSDPSA